jgi:hypothetical protein
MQCYIISVSGQLQVGRHEFGMPILCNNRTRISETILNYCIHNSSDWPTRRSRSYPSFWPLSMYLTYMALQSSRHRDMLGELTEWWEDISQGDVYSRVVLVEVPSAWGASTVLKEFKEIVTG